MKKRNKKADEGGNWMDTYGDMVTLLLCFFVLLYSISSVDQAKWKMIVQSFNPDAGELSQIVTDKDGKGDDFVPGGVDKTETEDEFNELYERLKQAVEKTGCQNEIELFKGNNYAFIRFRDQVFFDGDSSIIKKQGYEVLDQFINALSGTEDIIQEMQILGHTTQAVRDKQNNTTGDRLLSAERSAYVAAYIQDRVAIEPSKIVSMGYGQFHPIDSFETPESRSRNRRVEILIKKVGAEEMKLDEYYSEVDR